MKTTNKTTTNKPVVHYTEPYLLDPMHPVTVNLIGVGGTGSQVLTSLARMSIALRSLNHPGLRVTAYDPDRITEANLGRQLFSKSEVGMHKCTALVGRINRFFGFDWEAIPGRYWEQSGTANITISCVDSGPARREIYDALKHKPAPKTTSRGAQIRVEHWEKKYYWMDFGNSSDRGQVVIGTLCPIAQSGSDEFQTVATLQTVNQVHPEIFAKGQQHEPSCSLAEALGRQDLFINSTLAGMGQALLWKMFRQGYIEYHGLYLNLGSMGCAPLPIKK